MGRGTPAALDTDGDRKGCEDNQRGRHAIEMAAQTCAVNPFTGGRLSLKGPKFPNDEP